MGTTWRLGLVGAALAIVFCGTGCAKGASGAGGTGGFGAGNGDASTAGNGGGSGGAIISVDGGDSGNDAGPGCGTLYAAIRDFKFYDPNDATTLPDFENPSFDTAPGSLDEPRYDFSSGQPVWPSGQGSAYLDTSLDSQSKPHYLLGATQVSPGGTIHGADTFSKWYIDTAYSKGPFKIPLPNQAGTGTCASSTGFCFDAANLPYGQFFPIDGMGWGNQGTDANGVSHNYSFTTEVTGGFTYKGGEVLTFSGDDDVWVFVNNKLALDLGGVHSKESATINFDAQATWLGIKVGQTYPIKLFHAERHVVGSNFRFETSIHCLVVVK